MSIRQNKTRTLVFKECKFQLSDSRNLQQLMGAALKHKGAAVERFFPATPSGETAHFVNLHLTHMGALCGNMVSYTAGQNQLFMKLDQAAGHLDVNQLAPPIRDGQRTEFLEGIMFFAVFENSLILMQSNLLKAEQLARYLRWLIRDQCELLPGEEYFSIDDPVPISLRKKKAVSVRRINITKPVHFHTRPAPGSSGQSSFSLVADDPQAMALLKAVIPNAGKLLSDLQLKSSVDQGSIRAKVSVEWRGRAPEDGTPVLDELARDLPELEDEDDFEVELNDGTTIRRKELKRAKSVSLPFEDSMPALDVLFDRMVAWYQELQTAPKR